jgi:type I restriction enzyme S subunit
MSTATTHIDNKPSLQASHCEDEGRSKRKQSHPLAPALRFKDFNGDWNESRLNDVAEFKKGKGISKADISEDGVLECIRYGELYTTYTELIQDIVSKTNLLAKDLILSEFNDVIIPASGELNIDIATASCVLKSGVAYSGDLNIIRSKMDGIFLSFYLNNKRKFDIARLAQGVSVVHLYSSQLKTLKLNFPPLLEQQKIASFLSAVDEKIQQLTKKKALLEDYKKGVMQQLFFGQLRFKDENGKDYPDWEEKRLDAMISKFVVPMRDKPKELKGEIPWCRIEDFNGKYLSSSKSGQGVSLETVKKMNLKVYPIGTLLVSCSANLGFCAITEVELITNQTFIGLVPDNKKVDVLYLLYVMRMMARQLNILSSGTTISYLSRQQFEKFKVPYSSLKEQQKIATYLSGIDTKIEAVNSQITQTQTFKKGLLQQMFV